MPWPAGPPDPTLGQRWAEGRGLLGASKEAETHGQQSLCRPGWSHPKLQLFQWRCRTRCSRPCHHQDDGNANTQGQAGLMRTAKLSRDSGDKTAGTRQPLILPMNFTNVIFRLNYFKHCTESPGDSVHSTSISPQQIHSHSTAQCTALPEKWILPLFPV